jgi:hypothetical protein
MLGVLLFATAALTSPLGPTSTASGASVAGPVAPVAEERSERSLSASPSSGATAEDRVPAPSLANEASAASDEVDATLPGTLRTLRILGLESTREHVVRRELGWREGEAVDAHAWSLGLTRLWNTVLFSRVTARRVPVGPGVFDAEVRVTENFTIFPIFTGTATQDILWVRAGMMNLNLFGTFREVGGSVERFNDQVGGDLYFREPRLGDERVELFVQASRLARPRPGFTLLRSLGRVEVSKLFADDRVRSGLRVEGGYDGYAEPLRGEPVGQPSDPYALVAAPTRFGRLDRKRVTYEGETLDVVPSLAWTTGPSGVFTALSADARVFRRWPGNVNAVLRVLGAATGASTDNFLPYVGGTETVRGYPDSWAHGSRYAATNAELRWSALEWEYLVIMPTAFFDAAVVDDARAERRAMASAGAGVRFILPNFAAAGVRVDVAAPLTGAFGPGLSLGAYQFFW